MSDSSSNAAATGSVSHAGSSLRLKGKIYADEPLSIAGEFEGAIDVPKHQVSVTESAHVKADIHAGKVLICGTVVGNVVADDRVELTDSANMCGKLRTKHVRVQEGAVYRGELAIIRDDG